MTDLLTRGGAVLSECRRYRYRLTREWAGGPRCGFVLLNPSSADAAADDPTIRRCIGFAKREGCGSLIVLNLFALRATDPAELLLADDPFGPDADHHLLDGIQEVDGPLIAGWGANGRIHHRGGDVMAMIGEDMVCFGLTKGGHSRHPLYVPRAGPLSPLVGAQP